MKFIYVLFLVLVGASSTMNAQIFKAGTVTNTNNQTIEGRIAINNLEKTLLLKKDGNTRTYSFNNITSATINGRLYSKIDFENNNYLAHQLVQGKASLFDLSNASYLILKEGGLGKFINLEGEENAQTPGVLAVLFNDCNSIRDAINKIDELNERSLKSIVLEYNNCNYSDYTPTENEMVKANTYHTDAYRFYIGVQSGINNTTVNDFNSTNTTGFGLGLGLSASPSFTGDLQGNLFFDFDFSMNFTGKSDFNNGTTPLNYKINSYKLSVGMEYLFNKNGTIQPFLGIGYGYAFDYYKGDLGTISFKDEDKNYFFIPKAGLLYKLNNGKHLGFTLSYITAYKNDLSFIFGDALTYYPLVIDASSINLGVNYYF